MNLSQMQSFSIDSKDVSNLCFVNDGMFWTMQHEQPSCLADLLAHRIFFLIYHIDSLRSPPELWPMSILRCVEECGCEYHCNLISTSKYFQ